MVYMCLGEGAFGIVVRCRKKSTQEYYAMKVQKKHILSDHHQESPHRIVHERVAHAVCHHPFIVELFYAFQSHAMVHLVFTLCANGDLFSLLNTLPDKCLPHVHAQFYIAEIISALTYMHELGFIYRDLKPENVMLHEDNHIRIIDFGAVIYVGKSVSSTPDANAIYEHSIRSMDSHCIASLPIPKPHIKPHYLSKCFPTKLKPKHCAVFQPTYEEEVAESVCIRGRSNTSTESNITHTHYGVGMGGLGMGVGVGVGGGARTRMSSMDNKYMVRQVSGELSPGVEYCLRPRAFTITGMHVTPSMVS